MHSSTEHYACTCEGFDMANRKPTFVEKHIQHFFHVYISKSLQYERIGIIIIYQVYWKNFVVKHEM